MALKKPSDFFNTKREDQVVSVSESIEELSQSSEINTFSEAFTAFKNNLGKIEVLSDFSETLDNYRINIERVNYISDQVNNIQEEIQTLLTREDLDRAMMAQILVVEKSIQELQNKIKGINEDSLLDIRNDVSSLTEVVNDFIEFEVPKYKKLVVESEIKTDSRISELQESFNHSVDEIQNIITKDYQDLNLDITNKIELLEDTNKTFIDHLNSKLDELENFEDQITKDLYENKDFKTQINEKVTGLHLEIIRNETHIKVQNKTLQSIQEEVKDTLNKINLEEIQEHNHKLGEKIKYLEEVFEKFNEKEILTETLLAEPPSTDNKDPLTPLDQKFVTLDQLQDHYRLFINRVQQQLASLGGGGETRLEFLDDVDRNSAKQDGYVLQYSSTLGKFIGTSYVPGGGGNVAIAITSVAPTNPQEGNLWYDKEIGRTFLYYTDDDGSQWVDANPAGTSVSIPNYWISTNVGIHTFSNVGIGTTNPTVKLEVQGGDVKVGVNTSNGLILTSPNGTKYRLIVSDGGSLSTVLVQ